MMLRRTRTLTLIALTAGLVIIAGPSHAAPAQDGYQGACAIGVTEANPHAGDTITVTGDNFPVAPSTVPIMIDDPSQQIGTAHIGGSRQFSDQATIPSDLSAG